MLVVIGLFVWLLFRTYAIGRQAARLERPFAALVALGIGVWIGVQAFINIGVNMGVLPTKGLTLPLLSFGGSGIVANCIALAILLRVDYENRRLLQGLHRMSRVQPAISVKANARERALRPRRPQPAGAAAGAPRISRMTGTVMITAGGTGGHVFPGLAVAAKLVARGWRVFWLGTRDGMEAKLVPRARRRIRGRVVPRHSRQGLEQRCCSDRSRCSRRACRAARSSGAARRTSCSGFGGFASFPGALCGVAMAKPLVLHDANAVAGLANRVLAFGADRVLLGFPNAMGGRHAAKVEWVGNPLRDEIAGLPAPEARFAGRTGPLRLLVVGGSLGAAALNRVVPAALAMIPAAARPSVVHQAGARHVEALQAAYDESGRRGGVHARSSSTWRRVMPRPTSCYAAAAPSLSPSSPRSASRR